MAYGETLNEIRDELRRSNRLKALELSMNDNCDKECDEEIDLIMEDLDDMEGNDDDKE